MEKIWLNSYPAGVPAEINPDSCASLNEIVENSCHRYKHRVAFVNFGASITYSQLEELITDFAAYLQNELGLKKGDRFAVMLPNLLQYPVAMFGALKAGLIIVNINPLYTPRELCFQLKDSGAQTILVLENMAHVVEKALKEVSVKNVIVTRMGDLLPFPKGAIINFVVKYVKKMVPAWSIPNTLCFKEILEKGKNYTFKPVEVTGADTAYLQYTGGTTGVAKGAELTHRNMLANLLQAKAWMASMITDKGEVVVTPLPLYHIFSLTANCWVFLSVGAENVLITNPRDFKHFIHEIASLKFNAITGVNTLFNALMNTKDFEKIDFSAVKIVFGGGVSIQREVAIRWKKLTGKPLVEGYGLTECCPAVCINPLDIPDFTGAIGLPIPSTEVSIRNDEGVEVPRGQEGELCIRGPQVMKGYWNKPKETELAFWPDGWLRSGDMVKMDERGYVYLLERKKDMILVSGFNVYPNEIEEVIMEHPGVLEVAAVGMKSASSGEAVKIFVVKKDPNLTAEDLLKHCEDKLTRYKIPKAIEFVKELPKTPVGKILRRELRDKDTKA